jgi:alkanesulfonate monooxygenase SsuD/methylene tetrahydromethanopterin reductase-like flavin-dependent oxidoreductase (luciferase family)
MTSVGLMVPNLGDDGPAGARRVLDGARRAEAAGFDGVYVGDHLVHPRPMLESVVCLSAIAAATERVTIGPCVMLVALRQTLVLARQLATLAAFAPGRLRVGVGVGGEYPDEFDAAGVPLGERGARTDAVVRALRTHVDVPFVFGGWNRAALRRAARLGDGWIGYLLAPDGFARRRALLLGERAALTRSADRFTTGMLLPVSSGSPTRAEREWATVTGMEAGFPAHLFVAGPPAAIVEQLRAYWERGCTDFVLAPTDQGAGFLDQVELLARDVLPQVRNFG